MIGLAFFDTNVLVYSDDAAVSEDLADGATLAGVPIRNPFRGIA